MFTLNNKVNKKVYLTIISNIFVLSNLYKFNLIKLLWNKLKSFNI